MLAGCAASTGVASLVVVVSVEVNPAPATEVVSVVDVVSTIYIYIRECVCMCVCILPTVYTSSPLVRSGPNLAHTCRFISKW